MAYRLSTLADDRTVLLDDGLLEGESARWWDLGRLTDDRLADPLDALADPAGLDALTDAAGVPHGDPDGEVALGGTAALAQRALLARLLGMKLGERLVALPTQVSCRPIAFLRASRHPRLPCRPDRRDHPVLHRGDNRARAGPAGSVL